MKRRSPRVEDKDRGPWAVPGHFEELRFAVLATSEGGTPYASLIAYAFTPDYQTLIFATRKDTQKYRNIKEQPAVSILMDNRSQTSDDLDRAEAVTLLGTAKTVRGSIKKEYSAIFTERHPQLADFVNHSGTALLAVTIEKAVHVTQFEHVSLWTRAR